MTVPDSGVPTARAALLNLIAANSTINADSTIRVIFDEPNAGDVMGNDLISVGRVTQRERPYGMVGSGGAGWLMEDFDVEVIVSIFRAGDQAQTVFERAWTLVNAVRTAVRTDPTLSGTVAQAYPSEWDVETTWSEDGSGRFTTARGRVACNKQL